MAASSEVIILDRGALHLEHLLQEANGLRVDVGIFGGRAKRKTATGKKRKGSGAGTPIAAYALYNELGAPKAGIPERSFMRSAQAENRDKHEAQIRAGLDQAVAGNGTVKEVLGTLALTVVGDVKRKITTLTTPPNAESTKRRKGAGKKELIDTGTMLGAIWWRPGKGR